MSRTPRVLGPASAWWRRTAALSAVVAGLAACAPQANQRFLPHNAGSGRPVVAAPTGSDDKVDAVLWSQDFGFVRLEQAEASAQGPNDHPIALSATQVRTVLAQLYLEDGNVDPVPVFSQSQLRSMTGPIVTGLARADPDQDVTFAVTGQRGRLGRALAFGPLGERVVTTGRVFQRDGELNLILGIVNGPFGDQLIATGRLRAFTPGSRARSLPDTRPIRPAEWMHFASADRQDWVQVPGDMLAAIAEPSPFGTAGAVATAPVPAAPTALREEDTTAAADAPGSAAGTGASAVPPPPAIAPEESERGIAEEHSTGGPGDTGIEDRLRLLNRLRQQDLITEQEYRQKRQAILDRL